MNALAYRVGDSPSGIPLMKFTLTYDGELPSTGNRSKKTQKKWDMRKHFHPQLEELWNIHPAIKEMREGYPYMPNYQGPIQWFHHEYDKEIVVGRRPLKTGEVDLCAPIQRGKRKFKPLIRNSLAISCALKILFLRKELPGRIYQGGDLDNRIKTLLDALSVPAHPEQIVDDATIADPILCLVEDDALITGMSVTTERLLSRQNTSASEVRLIIEVDVRVTDARLYNTTFLGD